MLVADAEAARVIAIEKSAIAKIAQQIVVDNQLDQVVTVLRAEVEEVELPFGIKEVDVIISEWVGHGLFSKNRLASLIFARNKLDLSDGKNFTTMEWLMVFCQSTIFSMVFFTCEPLVSMVFQISTIGINGFSNGFFQSNHCH